MLAPDRRSARVRRADGAGCRTARDGWACLPPGDAALTRRVKPAGPSWAVIEKRGRKAFSKGLWAPRRTSRRCGPRSRPSARPSATRRSEAPTWRAASGPRPRTSSTFEQEVLAFLRFSPRVGRARAHRRQAVAAHATPVGSGTVARTKRIPVAERAEAAVIAWMRHQTTGYDDIASRASRASAARSGASSRRYRAR